MKTKHYGSLDDYEKKLDRVMERFGVAKEHYDWDHSRQGAWVKFLYKGVTSRVHSPWWT